MQKESVSKLFQIVSVTFKFGISKDLINITIEITLCAFTSRDLQFSEFLLEIIFYSGFF